MTDDSRKEPETDAEKIAAMKKFEGHCGPMRFIRECTAEEYIAAQKRIQERVEEEFCKCLDRLLDLPPR